MDNKLKAKILILVEGGKTDARLMERILQTYGMSAKYEIMRVFYSRV